MFHGRRWNPALTVPRPTRAPNSEGGVKREERSGKALYSVGVPGTFWIGDL